MSKLVGVWTCQSKENMHEFMEAVGIHHEHPQRQHLHDSKPTLTITEHGNNEWTIAFHSEHKNRETKFTLGNEFEEDSLHGVKAKSVYSLEGQHKLKKVQTCENGNVITSVFDAEGDKLIQTLSCKDAKATMTYTKN